jgi:2-amino-1-hydroxyethylphosphonate dioxygenase (glycine-forming)
MTQAISKVLSCGVKWPVEQRVL